MIQFRCECGKLLQAKEDLAGRVTRCPACQREFAIPSAGDKAASTQSSGRAAAGEESSEEGDQRDYGRASGPSRRSGKAIASLILGIAALPTFMLAGIPAIIMGILSIRDVNRGRGRVHGTSMAITGLVLGGLGCVLTVPALLVLGLLMPAVQKVRSASERMQSANNLKQLAIAMHNYHDTNGRLPPAVVRSKEGKPLYSWRVLLLPYVEEQDLFQQFKLDEPWDSPNNIKLLDRMPKVFQDPAAPAAAAGNQTVYQVFVGPKTAFERPEGENLKSFTDGTSNTILIVEAEKPCNWTEPVDLPYDPKAPLSKLGGHHPGGFNAAFADGSVRFVHDSISEAELRALITRNGGEKVTPP